MKFNYKVFKINILKEFKYLNNKVSIALTKFLHGLHHLYIAACCGYKWSNTKYLSFLYIFCLFVLKKWWRVQTIMINVMCTYILYDKYMYMYIFKQYIYFYLHEYERILN